MRFFEGEWYSLFTIYARNKMGNSLSFIDFFIDNLKEGEYDLLEQFIVYIYLSNTITNTSCIYC